MIVAKTEEQNSMIHTWINKTSENKLILFFNGLGMDEKTLCNFNHKGFDVCMFYNYNELTSIKDSFKEYDEIYVIAWSMGVWAAEQCLRNSKINITKSIAINGTSIPIDSDYGIDKKIFEGTALNWNDRNRMKFMMRIFASTSLYKKYFSCLPDRNTDEQKNELLVLLDKAMKENISHYPWDTAICGKQDLIFNYQNQINYWTGKANIISCDIPHYPFINSKNWNEIVSL